MALLKKEDFYNTFFQKDKISPVFSKISYKYNNALFFSSKNLETSNTKVNFISLFPQYLYPEIFKNKALKTKKIQQERLDGFGILIDGVKDVDSYLANNFKSKTRGPITRKIKRLEVCFTIRTKMFYGNITDAEYSFIMTKLKAMIERRFIQRNNSNEALGKWDSYLKNTLVQIKNKEASLFVLYANEDIVGISLNYHIGKVFIGHIIAYDIDYSKFGLGNTIVCKLLQWSIDNGYSIFDMGNGALDYKRIWSNFTYNYDYYVIYQPSLISLGVAQLQILKIKFKNILKKLYVVDRYRKLKSSILNKNKLAIPPLKLPKLETIQTDAFNKLNLVKIQHNDILDKIIKKTIIDFTFAQQEPINDIEVFKENEQGSFIIKGKKSIQKITIG